MSVSVIFHLMYVQIILVRFRLLRGHLLGKSCSLFVFCLFVISVISRFGVDGRILYLIAPVPGHYLLFTFTLTFAVS